MLNIHTNIDRETLLTVDDNLIQVEFANIGEGYNGDYDPNDPDDSELVRFYVYINANYGKTKKDGSPKKPDWEELEDNSCCTTVPCDENIEKLIHKAIIIHKRFRKVIDSYPAEVSTKKLTEELSWI